MPLCPQHEDPACCHTAFPHPKAGAWFAHMNASRIQVQHVFQREHLFCCGSGPSSLKPYAQQLDSLGLCLLGSPRIFLGEGGGGRIGQEAQTKQKLKPVTNWLKGCEQF